jgi:protein-S-isoprenylcysteine O-methyltransferase Ste14
MRPTLINYGIYAVIFWVAFAIWAVPEILGSLFQRPRNTSMWKDRGSYVVIAATIDLSILLAIPFAISQGWAAITWNQVPIFFIGIALMLVGEAFRWYAIWTLGRYFTRIVAIQENQQVIQSGPYRFIRHPAYAGLLLTFLGIGLALTNWGSLLILVALNLIGLGYRILVEERALQDGLGQPYKDYMQRTRRIIPFIF